MAQILNELYRCFYEKCDCSKLQNSVDENHKILIERLSSEDRKVVLQIMDELELICEFQSKDSFIQGFKLGIEIKTELDKYNDHSLGDEA